MKSQNCKIALFVCDDLIGLEITHHLIPQMKKNGFEPVIISTGSKLNRSFKVPPPEDIKFYGVELLRDVVLPFIEDENKPNPQETSTTGDFVSYKELAKRHGINFHEIRDVNDPAFINQIINDDQLVGGISLRFLQIFDQEIINVFKEKGFMWNLHSGILPEYKGLLIPAWAIANNENLYGWTLHRLDKNIDTGKILYLETMALDRNRPILNIYQDMIPKGITIIMKGLEHFQKYGAPHGKPQSEEEKKSYYPYPTKAQWLNLQNQGVSFAEPVSTIKNYVDKFTRSNSPKRKQLRNKLIQAVAEHERCKAPRKETEFYNRLHDEGYNV